MLRTLAARRNVYRVYATDRDSGDNGRVTYSLSATTPRCDNCFAIDQASGWITRGRGALQPNSDVCVY